MSDGWEDGLGAAKLVGPNHFNVGAAGLQQDCFSALVLTVDKLGGTVRHEVVRPGAGLQCSDHLFFVCGAAAYLLPLLFFGFGLSFFLNVQLTVQSSYFVNIANIEGVVNLKRVNFCTIYG